MALSQLNDYKNSLMKTGNRSIHLVADRIPESVTNSANKAMTTVSHQSSNAIAWAKKNPVKAAVFGAIGIGLIGVTGFFAGRRKRSEMDMQKNTNLPQ